MKLDSNLSGMEKSSEGFYNFTLDNPKSQLKMLTLLSSLLNIAKHPDNGQNIREINNKGGQYFNEAASSSTMLYWHFHLHAFLTACSTACTIHTYIDVFPYV